jgi:hypothetical protein
MRRIVLAVLALVLTSCVRFDLTIDLTGGDKIDRPQIVQSPDGVAAPQLGD